MKEILGFKKKDAEKDRWCNEGKKIGYLIPNNKLVPVWLKSESVSIAWLRRAKSRGSDAGNA